MNTSRIAYTPGESAGIGIDLAILLAQRQRPWKIMVFADPTVLSERAQQLKIPFVPHCLSDPWEPISCEENVLTVIPIQNKVPTDTGVLKSQNAECVLDALKIATDLCKQGCLNAMVTGPVNKGIMKEAGLPFSGHTEYLAGLCDVPHPVMMLVSGSLRVALATTHIPLREVPAKITASSLKQTLCTVEHALRTQFGLKKPHILVCGLNPHAGDNGALGTEEQKIIIPCLNELRTQNMSLEGPLAADTIFTNNRLLEADAVVAMYHDQGLPVLKHVGFGNAVNITLGLPFVRTSVGHGTGLDIAGSTNVRDSSLVQALNYAQRLVSIQDRQKHALRSAPH